ncbi:MAG: hypothetical protein PHP86_06765 [Nevskiales bacterium]|nr:hypothetical protein [Nevskiales bacterium]
MQSVLRVSAWMARQERLNALTETCMNLLARATIRTKRIRHADSLEGLGRQWQRGFPSAKQVPIKDITANTVFAEIHTPCPLRGTGDVRACHRMMQFDREVVRRAGGQFIVLSSQATPGNAFCRVAMRPLGADVSDLVPAHEVSRNA